MGALLFSIVFVLLLLVWMDSSNALAVIKTHKGMIPYPDPGNIAFQSLDWFNECLDEKSTKDGANIKLYSFRNDSNTRQGAEHVCRLGNGALAMFENRTEFQTLKCMAKKAKNHTFWIDGKVEETRPGTYFGTWSNGRNMSNDERCENWYQTFRYVTLTYKLKTKTAEDKTWCTLNDRKDDVVLPFICFYNATYYRIVDDDSEKQKICTKVKKNKPCSTNDNAEYTVYEPGDNVERTVGDVSLISFASTKSVALEIQNYDLPEDRKSWDAEESSQDDGSIGGNFLVRGMLELKPSKSKEEVGVGYSIGVNDRSISSKNVYEATNYGGDERGAVRVTGMNLRCMFYDPGTDTFSTLGTWSLGKGRGTMGCGANHTTIFAVMLTVQAAVMPFPAKVLGYATGAVSVIALILTIFALLLVKRMLQSGRTVVQIHLAACLLLLHLGNLFHDFAINNDLACQVLAVLQHFVMLSAGAWMLVEGVIILLKTSDFALRLGSFRVVRISLLASGWLFPCAAVIATTVYGFLNDIYMDDPLKALKPNVTLNYAQCWLSRDSGILLFGVIIPLAAMATANLVILIKVVCFVYAMSKSEEKLKPVAERSAGNNPLVGNDLIHVKAGLRAMLMLLPALGVPWALLFLAGTSVVFIYLTTVVNGLQGLFLFLVYVVFNTEVRQAATRRLGIKWPRMKAKESLGTSRSTKANDMSNNAAAVQNEDPHLDAEGKKWMVTANNVRLTWR